jgi:5-histidylcysteine sulfoxide synthase/putative 4-mercaptohistidine N1-methyltranferase
MTIDTKIQVSSRTGHTAPLVTKVPVLDSGDPDSKRQEILDYFHHSFTLYESLFDCLAKDEAYYHRANTLRQPLIFYYGHTSVFYINKLNVAKLIDQRIDPRMESILAIGVDEMSWDDLNEENYDWPAVEAVTEHRRQTREIVDRFIRECDFQMPIRWDSPMWIVLMGIEHERIHLETSSILMRELPIDLVKSHPVWGNICRDSSSAPANELIGVDGGLIEMGKDRTHELYGWDNEYGSASEQVDSFKASKYLVTNHEFHEFVEDEGYSKREHWTSEGEGWLDFSKAKHPNYWVPSEDGFQLRTMLEVIPLPWDWPAEINYLEAKAFCNWKSAKTGQPIRLPTEAEWYAMRNRLETDQPYWDVAPGNINLEQELSPCPVTRHEFHDGLFDLIGNVWQWTETPIDAYDSYEVHPIYDDFSSPTFDGKHNLFKGGCWISTGNYAIRDSRYAFRRHFFQYSGMRYVQAEPIPEVEVNVCEEELDVARSIEIHYGENVGDVANFPAACVEEIAKHLKGVETTKALDIGCASGRSSFELAQHFDHVDGVDFSVRLIEAPSMLQKTGRQRYVAVDEGELRFFREVQLSSFSHLERVKDKVAFLQGDACNLVEKFDGYNLVFAGNLLEWLYDPAKFLESIKSRILPGGLLVLASTYDWQESVTSRGKWLGGFKANTGENYTSLEGLQRVLEPEFSMVSEPTDLPFSIRESTRKCTTGLSELTVWKKKS